jgi:hypothetical protein
LDRFATVTYREGSDPPDLVLALDQREIGVELARVIGEDHAAGISKDLKVLRQGGRPEPVVWTPDPCKAISRVLAQKSAKYKRLGAECPEWLVLHDSVEKPGWYDQPVEGHAYFVERCVDALAISPFGVVILQSTYRNVEQWSMLCRREGRG